VENALGEGFGFDPGFWVGFSENNADDFCARKRGPYCAARVEPASTLVHTQILPESLFPRLSRWSDPHQTTARERLGLLEHRTGDSYYWPEHLARARCLGLICRATCLDLTE